MSGADNPKTVLLHTYDILRPKPAEMQPSQMIIIYFEPPLSLLQAIISETKETPVD